MGEATAIDERVVVAAWERQAFDRSSLVALGFSVVFRGVPSDAGGPDYQDAVLAGEDRELLRGDIEFHVRSSDWYRHGHDRDHRYDGVILHVVWKDDAGATVNADGGQVPILELARIANLSVRRDDAGPQLLPHPCVARYATLQSNQLHAALQIAARERFNERADRFRDELAQRPADDVLYAALLAGMGYASNRQIFRDLAEAVPWSWLVQLDPEVRCAVLLDAAALGPAAPHAPPARLAADAWRLTRLRPANHPRVRIEGAIEILNRNPRPADTLLAAVSSADRPAGLRALVQAGSNGHSLVGAGRADELVVSVLLPIASALDPSSERPWELFAGYRSPPANRWTRYMRRLMTDAGHDLKVRNAVTHQGLHHLYHRHCRPDNRRHCPVCGSRGL